MRTALAAVLIAAIAMPAAAQTRSNEGARILGDFLNALTGVQPQGEAQLGTGPQTQGATFAVTDLRQQAVCNMTFSGAGASGAVTPGAGCPGALRTITRWEQATTEELTLRDSANRIQWRGERVANTTGWIGGAADTLRVYSIAPSGSVGPAGATASSSATSQSSQTAQTFSGETIYGDWRITEPGQTVGCRVSFPRPANSQFAVTNAVQPQSGCPGQAPRATRWVYTDNTLTLTDNAGNVRATLRRVNDERWTGESGGVQIVMTRI